MNTQCTSDVYRSFLVKGADYAGLAELPCIQTSETLPQKLVPFSKAMSKSFKDWDCWVCFYEQDQRFERLWKNPKRYLSKLKNSKG